MKRLIFILLIGCACSSYASEPMFTPTTKLASICDEWNVAEEISGFYHTFKWRLTTDTMINATNYVKIEKNRQHKGALREDNNSNIYIVYPNNLQECLLYAFNAQIGDTLTNTCLGKRIVVKDIHPTTPKTFVLDVEYDEYDECGETYTGHWNIDWIKGIGYSIGTPIHYAYMLGSIHALDPNEMIICAYKNGEQVYISDRGDIWL